MKNIILFLSCICISGIISLIFGHDVGFDFRNYHLYLPYAFLHNRFSIDLIAAGPVHTFFNPLIDIPYFLIVYYLNNWPNLTLFLLGGFYGLLLFAVFKWVSLIFQENSVRAFIFKVILTVFSVLGIGTLLQIGHSSNENLLAFFGVISAYLLFRGTNQQLQFKLKYILGAAFLVSFAAGLKYTAVPAACGVGLCCLFLLIKNKSSYKHYLYVILAAGSGFLLTNGYFLWKKWTVLGNPLFPFYNHIFKSPFFPPEALANSPFVPKTWHEILFLPFLRLTFPFWDYILDFRLILGVLSFLAVCIGGLSYIKKRPLSKNYFLLACLFIGTYIPWIVVFGNGRYAIFLEIISCLLFTSLLRRFLSINTVCIILISLSIFSFKKDNPKWPRQPSVKQNITFSQPVFVRDGALVLVAGHYSFLIPFLNPKARYIGGVQLSADKLHVPEHIVGILAPLQPLDYQHNFPIREEILKHSGPIYLLRPHLYWMQNETFWEEYGLDTSNESCQIFHTNLSRIFSKFALCNVKKINEKTN